MPFGRLQQHPRWGAVAVEVLAQVVVLVPGALEEDHREGVVSVVALGSRLENTPLLCEYCPVSSVAREGQQSELPTASWQRGPLGGQQALHVAHHSQRLDRLVVGLEDQHVRPSLPRGSHSAAAANTTNASIMARGPLRAQHTARARGALLRPGAQPREVSRSRSSMRRIFPVSVFGRSSTNSSWRG